MVSYGVALTLGGDSSAVSARFLGSSDKKLFSTVSAFAASVTGSVVMQCSTTGIVAASLNPGVEIPALVHSRLQRWFRGHIGGMQTMVEIPARCLKIWHQAWSPSDAKKRMRPQLSMKHRREFTNETFITALALWFSDEAAAIETYGHIRDWDVSAVTKMNNAFRDKAEFNEDISKWDTSAVTSMSGIFIDAKAFPTYRCLGYFSRYRHICSITLQPSTNQSAAGIHPRSL